jgi:predicted anti-sigma-YlaC factor YlaD
MTELRTCKDFCKYLSDYLDGQMAEDQCRLIEEHLRKCAPCELVFRSLKLTVDVCCRAVSDKIPEDVASRLKAFLREHCCKDEVT